MLSNAGLIESTLAIIISLGTLLGFVWKSLTARIDRDLKAAKDGLEKEAKARADDTADLRHDLKNLSMKQDALDRSHNSTIQRVVATEATILAMKGAIDRTERNVDELVKIQRDRP